MSLDPTADTPLVLHADDLGISRAANSGIAEAARAGLLTSVSLTANGTAFDEAAQDVLPVLARSSVGVGVHLNLTLGRALGGATELVDDDGLLHPSWPRLLRVSRKRELVEAVESEWRAQIERAIGAGVALDHLNSHQHVHVIPPLFDLGCRLAVEYGIPMVRLPYERPYRSGPLADQLRPFVAANAMKLAVIGSMLRRCRAIGRSYDVHLNGHFVGLSYTGTMTVDRIVDGVDRIGTPRGPIEVLLHPARQPRGPDHSFVSPAARDYGLDPNRTTELKALCSADLAARLAARGYRLACWDCAWSDQADHPHRHPRTPPVPRNPAPRPLRTLLVVDETPLHHPTYVRRLARDCDLIEIVGALLVEPPGGTGPAAYMRRNLARLRTRELLMLALKQYGTALIGRLPRWLRGDHHGSVRSVLDEQGIPALRIASLDQEAKSWASAWEPDLLISSNSLIFPDEWLELPRLAAINRHSALLPAYGGVFPVIRAIQHGERFTGASVHRMVAEIDAGEVLDRRWVEIFPDDTVDRLYKNCFWISYEATVGAIETVIGELGPDPDYDLEPSYFSFPERNDWDEFRRRGGRMA